MDTTQAAGLTDEQIAEAWREANTHFIGREERFARIIEKKVRAALAAQAVQAVQAVPVVWTDAAILSLLRRHGDGPYGEEDIAVTRRFMQVAEELRVDLAASPAPAQAAPQTIDTAPQDGSVILIWPIGERDPVTAFWDDRAGWCDSGTDTRRDIDASHWAPVPQLDALANLQKLKELHDEEVRQQQNAIALESYRWSWTKNRLVPSEFQMPQASSPTDQPCTCPSGDGSLRWPCPQHAANRSAQSQAAQPVAGCAGFPTRATDAMREAFKRAYCEGNIWGDRIDAALDALLRAAPAAAPALTEEQERDGILGMRVVLRDNLPAGEVQFVEPSGKVHRLVIDAALRSTQGGD